MALTQWETRFGASPYVALALASAVAVLIGVLRNYSFLPDREFDGFFSQIDYVRLLMVDGNWGAFWGDPLSLVHALRYAVVWPFLTAERVIGPVGSLGMLQLLFWPLVLAFPPRTDRSRRDYALMALRLALLLLPLLVSGRTVIVAAGMGYLVLGILKRPFSAWQMFIGCFAAVLSSASILFSIGVLMTAGNWKGRSRSFYVAKAFFVLLLFGMFTPSVLVKVQGFSSGAVGYATEDITGGSLLAAGPQDDLGTGPLAAVQRVIMRSTLVESFRNGNVVRLLIYSGLFAAAWAFIAWAKTTGRRHPMLIVLALLSTGILLEGLALWPILLPLVWAYTGYMGTERPADGAS